MSCSLGIDLGTTSVKICVVQGDKILTEGHAHHRTNLPNRLGVQDARKIITIAENLLKDVVKRVRTEFGQEISRIAVAGQQHGLVLWNSDAIRRGDLDCSELYNWMYPGDPAAPKLPKSTSNRVFPGYGMRTLCELASHSSFDPEKHWDRCGNITDYFACYLTGSDEVLMSNHNAYAWGYSTDLEWNSEILPYTPDWIQLPKIVRTDAGTFVKLGDCRLEGLENIPVSVAYADLTACIMAVRGHYSGSDHAYLILGTSAQLCFVLPDDVELPDLPVTTHVFPFAKGLTLVAAASMNGGNTLDAFLAMIQRWCSEASGKDCSCQIDKGHIFSGVDKATSLHNPDENRIPDVKALFTKERGSEDKGVDISGMKKDLSLTEMLIGICRGVIYNLFSLIPSELLVSYGVKKLYLVGTAKNERFLVHIKEYLKEHNSDVELHLAETDTSAAYGVAL
ncbi:unnamed protein product [Cylicocyclus nassatus]|uniref:Carbohydrate kinase FGGY N-terminal domain-containing protein n=1 Tax=Cylicocyclus nassatus TaxID=53992 RepID=A0AA36GW82_CYLNA|nr:unnamed protein product [Cylicocyclus nassatus]